MKLSFLIPMFSKAYVDEPQLFFKICNFQEGFQIIFEAKNFIPASKLINGHRIVPNRKIEVIFLDNYINRQGHNSCR